MAPTSNIYYPLLINSLNFPFGMWRNQAWFSVKAGSTCRGNRLVLVWKGKSPEVKKKKKKEGKWKNPCSEYHSLISHL